MTCRTARRPTRNLEALAGASSDAPPPKQRPSWWTGLGLAFAAGCGVWAVWLLQGPTSPWHWFISLILLSVAILTPLVFIGETSGEDARP